MRDDWDARAQQDAAYYIATSRDDWTPDEFFDSGKRQATALLRPALEKFRFDPSGKRILEIGCGMGRLFPGFSEMFDEIWGIDVSAEMIKQGRELCPVPGAHFVLGDGVGLANMRSNYFDYCFSYLVFQHIPSTSIIWQYLDDAYRVLRPGGVLQLHFRRPYGGVKGLALKLLPASLHPTARSAYRSITAGRARGKRPLNAGIPGSQDTWWGTTVYPKEVIRRLSALGFADLELLYRHPSDDREDKFWAIGTKPPLKKAQQ